MLTIYLQQGCWKLATDTTSCRKPCERIDCYQLCILAVHVCKSKNPSGWECHPRFLKTNVLSKLNGFRTGNAGWSFEWWRWVKWQRFTCNFLWFLIQTWKSRSLGTKYPGETTTTSYKHMVRTWSLTSRTARALTNMRSPRNHLRTAHVISPWKPVPRSPGTLQFHLLMSKPVLESLKKK